MSNSNQCVLGEEMSLDTFREVRWVIVTVLPVLSTYTEYNAMQMHANKLGRCVFYKDLIPLKSVKQLC